MTTLTDELLQAIETEIGDVDKLNWGDSTDLELLVISAQTCGFLDGVEVHQLIPDGRRDDHFLLAVEETPTTSRTTLPIHWREVRPEPELTGSAALRHVLERVATLAPSRPG